MADYPEALRRQMQDATKNMPMEGVKIEQGKTFTQEASKIQRPPLDHERGS